MQAGVNEGEYFETMGYRIELSAAVILMRVRKGKLRLEILGAVVRGVRGGCGGLWLTY